MRLANGDRGPEIRETLPIIFKSVIVYPNY